MSLVRAAFPPVTTVLPTPALRSAATVPTTPVTVSSHPTSPTPAATPVATPVPLRSDATPTTTTPPVAPLRSTAPVAVPTPIVSSPTVPTARTPVVVPEPRQSRPLPPAPVEQ